MRRRLAYAVLAVTLGILPGCGDGVDPLPVDGEMEAGIAGSADPWDAEKTLTATMTNGNLVITGIENSTAAITLIVYNAAVGQFSAVGGELAPRIEATYGNNLSFSYTSARHGGTAYITITELSATKVVGIFDFLAFPVLRDPIGTPFYRIVNGTFDVRIR